MRSVFAVRPNEDARVGLDNEEIQLYRVKHKVNQILHDIQTDLMTKNIVSKKTRMRLTAVLKVRNDTIKIS